MGEVIKLTNENYKQKIVEAGLPAAVLFKSPSCPHCVTMQPVFEAVAQGYTDDQIKFGIVDVTEGPELAAEYGILSIPVTMLLKAGQEVDRIVGAVAKEQLEEKISSVLG